ncbi:MAG TPA: hypothetical protein VG323_07440 [Thermoanaerobaculia bacterium]|nr:hypothetical protein [Thermoanaerobaculia bacterium]
MSQVREHEQFDDEEAQLIEDPELSDMLDEAIDEADAHPEDFISFDELMRRLRNGERTSSICVAPSVRSMLRDAGGSGIATKRPKPLTKSCSVCGNCFQACRTSGNRGARAPAN